MLEVFDKQRKKLGVLDKAIDQNEVRKLNALDSFFFALPKSDWKNAYCQAFHLVRKNGGEFYRIIQCGEETTKSGEEVLKYECEHVLATLLNKVMYGYVEIGNLGTYTRDVLRYLFDQQEEWTLAQCEFHHQYQYGWEQENLFSALLSVPNRFSEKYLFRPNSKAFPYQLNLVKLDETALPKAYVRRGHNRLSLVKDINYKRICTRLYALGAGEGAYQTTIERINGGLPYVQSSQEYIDRYGLVEMIWTDRRFTDEESLMAQAQALLAELQEPYIEYQVDFIGTELDVGDVVEIVDEIKTYVTEVSISYGEVTERSYKIANKPYDVAKSLADQAERSRIEATYSQGASQIYCDSIGRNADTSTPTNISLYIPGNMLHVGRIRVKIDVSRFRAEVATTETSGSVTSSSSGGGSVPATTTQPATSSSEGGGNYNSSTSNAGASNSNQTSGPSSTSTSGSIYVSYAVPLTTDSTTAVSGSSHYHVMSMLTSPMASLSQHSHGMNHTHTFVISVDAHTHTFSVNAHSHTIAGHNHTVTVPAHQHTTDIRHNHKINPAINFLGNPQNFTLQVNGVNKQFFSSLAADLDVTEYVLDDEKMIPRDRWIKIGVLPNDFAFVDIAYNMEGFIQSHEGGKH